MINISAKKISVSMFVFILLASVSFGQNRIGKVALKVNELQSQNVKFESLNVFDKAVTDANERATATINKYTTLNLNESLLNNITQQKPEYLKVTIPNGAARNGTQLLLYKVNISSNGFKLETSDGRRFAELNPIVHYRGIIEGDNNSVVSMSFSKEETMGMISNNEGNFVIGKLEGSGANDYVFYNDKELVPVFSYECGSNTLSPVQEYKNNIQNNQNPVTFSLKCVDWYYEIDYDIFVGKGSLANVNSYIQGIFNQVSTLYNNDGVSITLQTLYVWTATDPYTGPSTSNYLNQFGAYRTSFAGDVANLVGYAGGGGIAYVNGLCASNTANRMGYMGISSSYNSVPTYSWTVEVVTHEDGHLLGSRHTHDCVWNGNNTRIDNCGPQAGYSSGSCAAGPMPSSGTIMSYCHLVSGVGINFNNGFGPQPAALILNTVNNASCLAACSSCNPPSQPGTISGNTSYCGSSALTYSVTAVSGATSYVWTLPSGWSGTSTTNSINVTTSGSGGTVSVIAVNSCGNSTARTLTVSGSTAPAQPGNVSGSTSVCQGTSQTYSVSAVSGATSYNWSLPSGWSGSSNSNSITVMTGSGSGNISVSAVNSCGTSTPQTISVAIGATPSQPLAISGQTSICNNSSYTYSVPVVSGATTYNWSLPSGWTGSSTTNSINVISGTSGGTISVTASNNCGTSQASSIIATLGSAPATPSVITGQKSGVCDVSGVAYSVVNIAGLTYNWTISSSGATITSGQGTNAITVGFASNATAGTLSVTASNGCGVSAARTANITTVPAQPGLITGTTSPCVNQQGVPYSIAPVAGAISYTWTVPTGARINDGTVTSNSTTLTTTATNVTVNFKTKSGNVRVKANNACGSGSNRSLAVAFGCRLADQSGDESFQAEFYPNPASEWLKVKFNSAESGAYQIQFADVTGKIVMVDKGEISEGENVKDIDISALPAGVYFVAILHHDLKYIQKLIKL